MAGSVPTLSAPFDAPRAAGRAGELALFALALALAMPARAAESPVVYLADQGGCAGVLTDTEPLPTYEFRPDEPFVVCLRTGLTPSPSDPCQTGTGDEICGFTVFIEGVPCPITTVVEQAADVSYCDENLNRLGINQLGLLPAGMEWELVTLTVAGPVQQRLDPLELGSGTDAVAADLIPTHVIGAKPLPEPGTAAGLCAGVAALWALARLRHRGRGVRALAAAALAVPATLAETPARAESFTEEAPFTAAVQNWPSFSLQRIDFEAHPLGPLPNGTRVRQARFEATEATELEVSVDPVLGQVAWPGGTASSHDDVRIDFDAPVRAAGLYIVENTLEEHDPLNNPGEMERARFLDGDDEEIGFVELPDNESTAAAFVGWVVDEGEPPIASIEIKAADSFDDLGIDNVLFDPGFATPFADAPSDPNVVGAPDGQTSGLGSGPITVVFTDNTIERSGDAQRELRIVESPIGGAQDVEVEISANGTVFYPLGTFIDPVSGIIEIDIDPFVLDHDYTHVKISDGPGSGVARIDAVEALSGRLLVADGDDDHVADDFDNCDGIHNPKQGDGDTDGVGDLCEAPALVLLRRNFDPQGQPGPTATLNLHCGGQRVDELIVGVWLPPSIDGDLPTYSFGDADPANGCTLPKTPPDPSVGISPTGCSLAGELDPTISPDNSGIFTSFDTTVAFRDDVVYVVLYGKSLFIEGGPSLCQPGEAEKELLPIYLPDTPLNAPFTLSLDVTYNYDAQGKGMTFFESRAEMLRATHAEAWNTTLDLGGGGSSAALAGGEVTASSSGGGEIICASGSGELCLKLKPQACWGEEIAKTWSLSVTNTSVEMRRVAAGLLGTHGASYDGLFVDGCATSDGTSVTCSVSPFAGQVGGTDGGHEAEGFGLDPYDNVDEAQSYTEGPPAGSSSQLDETLYAGLDGACCDGMGDVDETLNPSEEIDWCIATIHNEQDDSAPTIFVRDGFSEILYPDGSTAPYVKFEGSSALDDKVHEGIQFNAESNVDSDNRADADDNCPFTHNDADTSTGLQADANENGWGDACECGDPIFDESDPNPSLVDLDAIRQHLVGDPDFAAVADLCSVSRDQTCDTLDALIVERLIPPASATPQARCDAALPD